MHKQCDICKRRRKIKFFNKKASRKDGLQTSCQDCNRAASRKYYQENREKHARITMERSRRIKRENADRLYEYLATHPCVDCGESDPIVLEFDHVRGQKRAEISKLRHKGNSWAILEMEIQKCEVRCANCHKRKTAKERNFYAWRDKSFKASKALN